MSSLVLYPDVNILLKQKRKAKRLSQTKLSELSGISKSYISELESGKYNNPRITVIFSIATALECSIYDLVEFKWNGSIKG